MTTRIYLTYENGKHKRRPSNLDTVDFLSIKIGASGLEIKETATNFDFSNKKLTGVLPGAVSGEAVEFGQYTNDLLLKLNMSVSGVSNGLATLDSGGKVPAVQLPNSVMELQGFWNATSNTPTLADGVGGAGDVYLVSVSGTQDLGSGSQTFYVNDFAIYAGGIWKHSPAGDQVVSVNDKRGVVVLTTSDIAEGSNKYYSAAQARSDLIAASISDSDTTHAPDGNSVFDALALKSDTTHNHTGVYAPVSHDHTAANITDFAVKVKEYAIAQAITDGVTGFAPSEDVVFDALALKSDTTHNHSGVYAPISHSHSTGDITGFSAAVKSEAVSQTITDGVTGFAPSENAVFDALALKADASLVQAPTLAWTNKEGGAVTIRQIVYQTATAGQMNLAQATDALDSHTVFGMVKDASIANDAPGDVYAPEKGTRVSGFIGLDPTKPIYLSRTAAGSYQQDLTDFVAGNIVVELGKVLSATEIIWDPKFVLEF